MIKFKNLHIKNFRSYKELELNSLNEMGLTLVSGDNGSGKSTIRSAIEYLLLDHTSEGIPVDELCRDGDKPCMLKCDLEMENGDIVRIVKFRNDPTEKNKTYLYINEDDSLTTTDRRVTQKNIEKLLGITPDLLFSSTMFSQDSPSFVECPEKDRKDILYNFIDREKYDKLLKNTQAREVEIEGRIKAIDDNFTNTQTQLRSAEEYHEKLDETEKEYIADIKAEIIELLKERDDLKPLFTEILEQEIEDLKNSIPASEDLTDNVALYESKLIRLKEKGKLIDRKMVKLEKNLSVYQSKLDSIKDSTCNLLSVECPLLSSEKEELEKDYAPLIEQILKEIETLDNKLKDTVLKRNEVMDKMDEQKELADSTLHLGYELDSKIKNLDTTRKFNEQLSKSVEQLDNKIKAKSESLKTNKFAELREETRLKIKSLYAELDHQEKAATFLDKERQYYTYWAIGFSRAGIPNMKMEGILGSLEEETNNYLSKISDNIYVEIDAQTELKSSDVKEKVSYKVHHPTKAIKNYKSYSGGERQRVKLSDIFAFNSLLGKFDIMILDEVLEGSVDDKGKSLIISMLREKASELGSLFVISHDDYIKDSFDNTMYVRKTNGISKIRG